MLKFGRMRMVALTAILLLLLGSAPVSAQSIPRRYIGNAVATKLTVNTTSTLTGDVAAAGNVAVAGALTAATFANITAQSVITLTNNATLTPVGSLQPIAAASAIGTAGGTKIAHTTDYLTLVNIGAQTITFTETTGLNSAGNIALGATDSATLVWANGAWYQVAASNN